MTMTKEKVVLDSLKVQLENAIDDATKYITEESKIYSDDEDRGIYEGRLELAQELLEYLEEKC